MTGSTLSDPLGGLTDTAWDVLAADHFYSSAAWSRFNAATTTDRTGAAALPGRVAAVPVAEITALAGPLYRWSELLTEAGLPGIAPLGLLVGPRQGYHAQFLVAPEADRDAAVAALVAETQTLLACGTPGRSAVAMYLPTADARAAFAAGGVATPVLLETDASLHLPSGGWDDWLGTLTSKRRVAVRHEVRLFEAAGYEVEHAPLSERYEELGALARATASKYGAAASVDTYRELLRSHVDGMGDAAQVAVCRRNGEPVGLVVGQFD